MAPSKVVIHLLSPADQFIRTIQLIFENRAILCTLYHSVTGKFPEGGEPFHPENTLTVKEVLMAWTSGGAYDFYRENQTGTLEAGKQADIAVLSDNVFTRSMDTIRDMKVTLTLVDGRVVYEA